MIEVRGTTILLIGKSLGQMIILNLGDVLSPRPLQLGLPSPYIDDGSGIEQ
jgi:hypothetical protein